MVSEENFEESFFIIIVEIIAEKTAKKRNRIPFGLALRDRSFPTNMITIPEKEIKTPVMLSHESFSFNI